MKTTNQKTEEVIKGSEKTIFMNIYYWTNNVKRDDTIGDTLIELISKNGLSEINKSVALNCIDRDINPTKEEAIELTYEISKNVSSYLGFFEPYKDSCKNDAFDVLRDIYPNKTDEQLRQMIR